MRRSRKVVERVLVSAILLVFTVTALALAQDKPMRLALQEKFDDGLKLYRQGEYEKAAELMDEVLAMNPNADEALILRERAGIGMLVKLMRDDRYRASAEKILRAAAKREEKNRRDPAGLQALIEQLGSEEFIKQQAAIIELRASGPFAVPYLLDAALSDKQPVPGGRKVNALIALRGIGQPAIPPLVAALWDVDDATAIQLLKLIRQYPDSRAVPALVAVVENKKRGPILREIAASILKALAKPPTLPAAAPAKKPVTAAHATPVKKPTTEAPAPPRKASATPARAAPVKKPVTVSTAKACLALAMRYYQNDPGLVAFMPPNERVLWKWNPNGKSFAEKITFADVPDFAYPRRRAEDLLLKGMKYEQDLPELVELFICNSYMLLEEDQANRDQAVVDASAVQITNESLGADYLYRALGRALREKNAKLVSRCIEALRRVADPRPTKGRNALIAALAYPNSIVRVTAAEALMQISPTAELGGAGEVINVVATSLGAPAHHNVAVVTGDKALYDRVAGQLSSWNTLPKQYRSSSTALGKAKSTMYNVYMLVIDTRVDGDGTRVFVNEVRRDSRTAALPIVLLAEPKKIEQFKKSCRGKVLAVLPLKAPAEDLRTAVQIALGAQTTPAAGDDIRKNEELLRRILRAVAALPAGTGYPIQTLASPLATLLKGYPDDIRVLALEVLDRLDDSTLRETLYGMFVNTQEPLAVRRRAGAAFVRLLVLKPHLESDQVAALRGMMSDATEEIRSCAVRALAIADLSQSDREAYLLSGRGK